MATLSETATWTAGIYQLERLDQWDAGVGGAGKGNQQAKELANRTVYLKTEIEKRWNRENFYTEFADQAVPTASTREGDGSTHTLLFPLGDWDYATPNDGITRDYIVTMGCQVGPDWTYSSSNGVTMKLIKSTAGPVSVELASGKTFGPGTMILVHKKLTIGPNEKVIVLIVTDSVAATVNISKAFFHIEEVIKA